MNFRPLTIKILGENGIKHLTDFHLYPECWDGEGSRSLKLGCLETLEDFLEEEEPFAREPSVSLTREGNLILIWEIERGNGKQDKVEVECYPDHCDIFTESYTVEEEVLKNVMSWASKKLY